MTSAARLNAGAAELSAACGELERERRRVVDRVGHLPIDRLADPAPPWPSRGRAVRDTAQLLADLAHSIERAAGGGTTAGPPSRHEIPPLPDHALADVVAVTGADLRDAACGVAPGTPVWCADGAVPVEEAVRRGADAVRALRRAL